MPVLKKVLRNVLREPLQKATPAPVYAPDLDLKFAEELRLDPRVDFSRGSNATVVDSDGTLKWAGHNLVTYSQEFDNAAWQKFDTTVTANSSEAPDGTLTAEKMTTNVATTNSFAIRASVSHTGSTYSVYAKADEKDKILLFGSGKGYGFNLTSGSSFSVGGITDSDTNSITDVGNGWYRCSISVSSGSFVDIYILDSTSYASYTGDGTSGIYLWGAHLYRSDKEMQERTDVATGLETYYPTTSSAYYAPRFDHDPATNESLGLLIEESRTNQILASEDFSAGSWGAFDLTVTTNQVASPDGTTNADKITEGTGSVDPRITDTISGGIGTNQTYATSCFLKDDDARYGYVTLRSKLGSVAYAVFDLEDGVVHSTGDYGDSSFTSASMEDCGNGWYRCILISVSDTTDVSSSFVMIGMTDSSTDPQSGGYPLSITGDGSSLYVYGAQLEVGAFPTSYIPTSGSTVARSADVADVPVSDFNYCDTEYTLFTDFQSFAEDTASYLSGFLTGDGNNRFLLRVDSGGSLLVDDRLAGTGQIQAAISQSYTSNAFSKFAFGYKENDFALALDGGSVTTDTNGGVGIGATTLAIGRGFFGANTGNNHYKQITYFARRLDDATLQALTQPSLEPSLNLVFDSSETSYVNTGLTR